ncbi:unnamed protein product [Caenorhabditis auriculariae]|uniref:Piwi domain-containing protein n=1 Tax=Caenorhabditis auriculariae TaxID=2777116 RepID=A0A8S1HDP8_9PELO|nr:unnamed protein product [Caenorhabditis auriculariae]
MSLPKNFQSMKISEKRPKNGMRPLPSKRPGGKAGKLKKVVTNVRILKIKNSVPIFKYDVSTEMKYALQNGELSNPKSLTKGSMTKDSSVQRRKQLALAAMESARRNHSNVFSQGNAFYDGQASLYTDFKIPGTEGEGLSLSIPPEDITNTNPAEIRMVIKKTAETFQASTSDLGKALNVCPALSDFTTIEALNVAVSNYATSKDDVITYDGSIHYLYQPKNAGLSEKDAPALSEDKQMAVGMAGIVGVYEGTDKPMVAVVVELKKSAFHSDHQPLYEKLKSTAKEYKRNVPNKFEPNDPLARLVENLFKGLELQKTYGRNAGTPDAKSIVFGGFGQSAASATFEHEGRPITVQQYFQSVLGIKLQTPHIPTVYDSRDRRCLLPLELLIVSENQRVKTEQQTKEQQKKSIKATAILPEQRLKQTEKIANYLKFSSQNEDLKSLGIEVEDDFLKVPARILEGPNIKDGKGVGPLKDNCKWDLKCLIAPARIVKWTVIVIMSPNLNYQEYILRLSRKASQMGLRLPNPVFKVLMRYENDIEVLIRNEKNNGTEFVLFIARDDLNLHPWIKYFELKHDIATQEIKCGRAAQTIERNDSITLQNVILKLNLKNGGLNYELTPKNPTSKIFATDQSRLFVGIEMSHGVRGKGFSVLGWSANIKQNPSEYLGGHYYVKNTQEENTLLPTIRRVIERCLETCAKLQRKIGHVFVYLNGVSEGQYADVNVDYVEAIRSGFGGLHLKVTVVAVSSIHNVRLYQEEFKGKNASETNIWPGSVVDSCIVSPVINEFFLQSHLAFQGTANTPKYALVNDDSGIPMDILEIITHQLTFLHQIGCSAISVPVPLYMAGECATRGADLLATARTNNEDYVEDIELLNTNLVYDGKKIASVRINA